MERLWLANLEPGTTDDEVKELVRKYAPDLECSEIKRMDGDGSRPAVLMTFTNKKFDSLEAQDPARRHVLEGPQARLLDDDHLTANCRRPADAPRTG